MTTYDVIGRIEPDDDCPAPYEMVEQANAKLGGDFRFLAYYESGQGRTSEFMLVRERDDDD